MNRKGTNLASLRFARLCVTIVLPFVIVWFAVKGALRAARSETRETIDAYREVMRKTEIDL